VTIPIANLYYLLCYAWDEFAPQQMASIAAESFPDTLHLFASLLVLGVRTLHRRGFEMGYMPVEERTTTVRGRILLSETIRTRVQSPARVYCSYDELRLDTLTNRILRQTLWGLLHEASLQPRHRAEVRSAVRLLAEVSPIRLNVRVFYEVRLHHNNHFYSFLLSICRFLYESLGGQDQGGRHRFREVDRDEKRMRRIFEKFVRNFYARRQDQFAVTVDHLDWTATPLQGASLHWLPRMITDVTLRSPQQTIVVECKYTPRLFQEHYATKKLRSQHLSQLCTYLRAMEERQGPDGTAKGILLYPAAEDTIDQTYLLHGHEVRIKTLNLKQRWPTIDAEMLKLLGTHQVS
jgi:5-methylcytosine-specific restriction enzyme subunit McrC